MPDTRLVYVADRESDIVALMERVHVLGYPVDWLLRSKHNRNLEEIDNDGERKLWDKASHSKPLGEISFTHPRRGSTKARKVTQSVQVTRATLPGSRAVQVTCLIATETSPPKGCKPVVWRLLSNRILADHDDVLELIDWYRARWEIEMFFHVLKNGCTVEELQLCTMDRVQNALALYMVIAWKIARLMRLGRVCPKLDASLFFDEDEIKGAWLLAKKVPPAKTPTLNEMMRMIAILGGFIGRKSDGEPSLEAIWTGLSRVQDAMIMLQSIREFSIA